MQTGLIKVQPDAMSPEFLVWLEGLSPTDYPGMVYPDKASYIATNGCQLSSSANRTYYLEKGDYLLETSAAANDYACGYFKIKMDCSAGGATASPEDSDPGGFSVDADTGAITGTPKKVRDGYQLQLVAVDAAQKRTDIADWTFNVEKPPEFSLSKSASGRPPPPFDRVVLLWWRWWRWCYRWRV